jgi:2,5-diketo-D-gluconate reductase A
MNVTLNDGRVIPQLGLGVWQTPAAATADIVAASLQSGYRHIDTAAIYGNEAGVGQGLAKGGVARADVFVTTKVGTTRKDTTPRCAPRATAWTG